MLIFTIDPHEDEVDNNITTYDGVMIETLPGSTNARYPQPRCGLPLGYFTQRPGDIVDTPLHPKYFVIFNTEEGEALTHMKLSNSGVPEGKTGLRFGAKMTEDEITNDTRESCAVYLKVFNPNGRARFCDAVELRREGILLEGRYEENNVVRTYDPEKRVACCYPSLLILNTNDSCSFIYRNNTTHTTRKVTFHFDGEELVFDSNEPLARRPKAGRNTSSREPRTANSALGTFGQLLVDAGEGTFGKHDRHRAKYDRRQKDRNYRREHRYDSWQ